MGDCLEDVFAPQTTACAGHGDCFFGACICSDGWTGVSDFVISNNCHMNEVAVTVMWTVVVLLPLTYTFCVSLRAVIRHVHAYYKATNIHPTAIQRIKLLFSLLFGLSPAVRLSFVSFLVTAFWLPMVLMKVAYNPNTTYSSSPRPTIGHGNTAMTVLYCLGTVSFYICVFNNIWMFGSSNIHASRVQAANVESKLTQLRDRLLVLTLGNILSGFSPLLLLHFESAHSQRAVTMFHFYSKAFLLLSVYVTERSFIKSLLEQLEGHSSATDKRKEAVISGLKVYLARVTSAQSLMVVVNILWTSWPWLLNSLSYVIPLQFFIACAGGLQLLRGLELDQTNENQIQTHVRSVAGESHHSHHDKDKRKSGNLSRSPSKDAISQGSTQGVKLVVQKQDEHEATSVNRSSVHNSAVAIPVQGSTSNV